MGSKDAKIDNAHEDLEKVKSERNDFEKKCRDLADENTILRRRWNLFEELVKSNQYLGQGFRVVTECKDEQ